jgi:hypothetical protein
LWWRCGFAALPPYFAAIRLSLRLRDEVEKKRSLSRREFEHRWLV